MSKMVPVGPCTQAWHGGLRFGILHECVKTKRHYRHENADKSIAWTGDLTDEEEILVERLRAAQ